MEPFVPEPEERISTKDSLTRKGKFPPHTNGGGSAGRVVTGAVSALVVAVVMSLVFYLANSGENEQVQELSARLDSLDQQLTDLAADSDSPATAATMGSSGLDDNSAARIDKLEKLVAAQVSDLDTMRAMVAETLSKLDADLEGSLLNYYEVNRDAIRQLRADLPEMDSLKNSLTTVRKDLQSLTETISETDSVQQEVSQRIDSLEADMERQEASVSSLQSDDESLGTTMTTVQEQLAALDIKLESRVSDQAKEMEKVTAELARAVSDVQGRVAAIGGDLETVSNLKPEVEALSDRVSTLNAEVENKVSDQAMEKVTAELRQAVSDVRNRVGTMDGDLGSFTSLRQDLATLQEQIAELGAEIENSASDQGLRELATDLGEAVSEMQSRVAAVEAGLADKVSGQAVEQVTAPLGEELRTLQGQVSGLKAEVDSGPSGDSVRQLASTLENVAIQVDDITARLGENREELASQAKRHNSLADRVDRLPAVPGNLQTTVDGLKESQGKLAKELQVTRGRLNELSSDLQEQVPGLEAASRVAQPVAASEIASLKDQLKSLSDRVDQARAGLASYDRQMEELQTALESRTASTDARLENLAASLEQSTPGDLQAEVDRILRNFEVIKQQHPYAEFVD